MSYGVVDLLNSLGRAHANAARASSIFEEPDASATAKSAALDCVEAALPALKFLAEDCWPQRAWPPEYHALIQALESAQTLETLTPKEAAQLRRNAAIVSDRLHSAIADKVAFEERRLPALSDLWNKMGERSRVDVALMQFDIRGSTRLQRELPTNVWSALLSDYLSDADRIVRSEGGWLVNPSTGDGKIYGWPDTEFLRAFSSAMRLLGAARTRNMPPGIVGQDGQTMVPFGIRTVVTVGTVNLHGRWLDVKADGPALTMGARVQEKGHEERGDNGVLVAASPAHVDQVEREAGRFLVSFVHASKEVSEHGYRTWISRPEPRIFRRGPPLRFVEADPDWPEVPVTIHRGSERCSAFLRDAEPRAVRIRLTVEDPALARGVEIRLGTESGQEVPARVLERAGLRLIVQLDAPLVCLIS